MAKAVESEAKATLLTSWEGRRKETTATKMVKMREGRKERGMKRLQLHFQWWQCSWW